MITDVLKIAYQGAPGAFSHQAGWLFAQRIRENAEPSFISCTSFEDVFNRVISHDSTFGVIPLENSSIGSISINYDLLWSHPVSIVGEISTPIHHHVIGIAGADVDSIAEVYSHPAALDQCRKFFAARPKIRPIAHFDTGGAVKFIAEGGDPTKAAIAGEQAAGHYGLDILLREIEDYPENTTRFAIISLRDENAPWPDPPHKLSCAMELPNTAGSVANVLKQMADLEINLTKFESRPIPETRWHYRFFLDLEIKSDAQEAGVTRVLNDSTEVYKIFGRYPAS
jgi:prephenate dehydratase